MKKKKKKKHVNIENTGCAEESAQVLLGVRVTESERQKIKMHAIQRGTTVTQLIREFIDGL